MGDLFKSRFQGYNGKELVSWLTLAVLGTWGFFIFMNPIVHIGMFMMVVIFTNLTMGNIMYPRWEGYIFLPIKRWWYHNCRKLGIEYVEGRWYYTSLCDIRTWALYDQDGYLAGWHGEDPYEGYMVFVPASTRHGNKRIHSLSRFSRWRSGKLPKSKCAEIISDSGTIVGHTTYTD